MQRRPLAERHSIISNLITVLWMIASRYPCAKSCIISGDASHSFSKAVEWSVSLCMHTILTFQQYPELGVEFSNTLWTETIIGSILWICFKTGNGEELQDAPYLIRRPPSSDKHNPDYQFKHCGVKHTNQIGSIAQQRCKWSICQ